MRALLAILMIMLAGSTVQAQTPDEFIANITSRYVPCDYRQPIRNDRLDDSHKVLGPAKAKKQKADSQIKKLSLSAFFRPGRYDLSPPEDVLDGSQFITIRFQPKPPDQQIPAQKGEDENYIRAMNNSYGSIVIDRNTGDLVDLESHLAQDLVYTYAFFRIFTLTELEVIFEQQSVGTKVWVPHSFRLEVEGDPRIGPKVHNLYRVEFDCGV